MRLMKKIIRRIFLLVVATSVAPSGEICLRIVTTFRGRGDFSRSFQG